MAAESCLQDESFLSSTTTSSFVQETIPPPRTPDGAAAVPRIVTQSWSPPCPGVKTSINQGLSPSRLPAFLDVESACGGNRLSVQRAKSTSLSNYAVGSILNLCACLHLCTHILSNSRESREVFLGDYRGTVLSLEKVQGHLRNLLLPLPLSLSLLQTLNWIQIHLQLWSRIPMRHMRLNPASN